jgi:hypothetical protein
VEIVEVFLHMPYVRIPPPLNKYLHSNLILESTGDTAIMSRDIDLRSSTKRSSNLAPFRKISRSRDGGGNRYIFP